MMEKRARIIAQHTVLEGLVLLACCWVGTGYLRFALGWWVGTYGEMVSSMSQLLTKVGRAVSTERVVVGETEPDEEVTFSGGGGEAAAHVQ